MQYVILNVQRIQSLLVTDNVWVIAFSHKCVFRPRTYLFIYLSKMKISHDYIPAISILHIIMLLYQCIRLLYTQYHIIINCI